MLRFEIQQVYIFLPLFKVYCVPKGSLIEPENIIGVLNVQDYQMTDSRAGRSR